MIIATINGVEYARFENKVVTNGKEVLLDIPEEAFFNTPLWTLPLEKESVDIKIQRGTGVVETTPMGVNVYGGSLMLTFKEHNYLNRGDTILIPLQTNPSGVQVQRW